MLVGPRCVPEVPKFKGLSTSFGDRRRLERTVCPVAGFTGCQKSRGYLLMKTDISRLFLSLVYIYIYVNRDRVPV